MRRLATIRKIEEVKAIPDADKICAYRVDGWWVVDAINKYVVGDWVVYCEPDSWIPHSLAPFLRRIVRRVLSLDIYGQPKCARPCITQSISLSKNRTTLRCRSA